VVMGLAERIVDLVATGRTLRENGLVEVEEILKASARLIVNRASLKTRYRAIQGVIEGLRTVYVDGKGTGESIRRSGTGLLEFIRRSMRGLDRG